ncbi:MAG: hypothetical protein DWH84_00525 [Planctomycetota bacterium]|nr:MAG: hypothetical protein DWH84_00525 [Planctomycetota bacterium]
MVNDTIFSSFRGAGDSASFTRSDEGDFCGMAPLRHAFASETARTLPSTVPVFIILCPIIL